MMARMGNQGLTEKEFLSFVFKMGLQILNMDTSLCDALKEFDLRQVKSAPSAPPSSGGEGGPRLPQPKRRAIGTPKEDEIALRDAILETLEHETPTATA